MADVDVSIYEEISVAEDYSGDIEVVVSTVETISVSEDNSSDVYFPLSVVDAIVLSESVVADHSDYHWYIDPRDGYSPIAPVAEMAEAFFGNRLSMEGEGPTAALSAMFGFQLDELAPTGELVGELSGAYTDYWQVESTAPVAKFTGAFGSALIGKSPVLELEGSMYGNWFVLDKRGPFPVFSAEMIKDEVLILSKASPVWRMTGEMLPDFSGALDGKAPLWYLNSTTIAINQMTLDRYGPIWVVRHEDALMYSLGMDLDADAPVGTMTEATGVTGQMPGVLVESDRFADHILQYERWPDAI